MRIVPIMLAILFATISSAWSQTLRTKEYKKFSTDGSSNIVLRMVLSAGPSLGTLPVHIGTRELKKFTTDVNSNIAVRVTFGVGGGPTLQQVLEALNLAPTNSMAISNASMADVTITNLTMFGDITFADDRMQSIGTLGKPAKEIHTMDLFVDGETIKFGTETLKMIDKVLEFSGTNLLLAPPDGGSDTLLRSDNSGGLLIGGALALTSADLDPVSILARLEDVEINIGVNALDIAANGSLTGTPMADGFRDFFVDEVSVDTNASTGESYDAVNDKYDFGPPSTEFAHIKFEDNAADFLVADSGDGGLTWTANVTTASMTIPVGKIGRAFMSTGAGEGVISTTHITVADGNPWSMSYWFKHTNIVGQSMVFRSSDPVAAEIRHGTRLDGAVDLVVRSDLGVYLPLFDVDPVPPSGTPILTNIWYHVVLVMDTAAGEGRAYVNASLRGTDTTASSPQAEATGGMHIMRDSHVSAVHMTGSVDDWRFYTNKVLNQANVDFLYNNGDGTQESLLAAGGNLNLISEPHLLSRVPSEGKLIFIVEPISTIIENTDLKVFASKDGGTNEVQFLITTRVPKGDGTEIWATELTSFDAATASNMVWRIETTNGILGSINGWVFQAR